MRPGTSLSVLASLLAGCAANPLTALRDCVKSKGVPQCDQEIRRCVDVNTPGECHFAVWTALGGPPPVDGPTPYSIAEAFDGCAADPDCVAIDAFRDGRKRDFCSVAINRHHAEDYYRAVESTLGVEKEESSFIVDCFQPQPSCIQSHCGFQRSKRDPSVPDVERRTP